MNLPNQQMQDDKRLNALFSFLNKILGQSVRYITSNIFDVNVKNLPQSVKINNLANLENLIIEFKNRLNVLQISQSNEKQNDRKKNDIKQKELLKELVNIQDEIINKKFPEMPAFPEIPKYPDKISVKNIKDYTVVLDNILKKIDTLKIKNKEIQKVEIVNHKDDKNFFEKLITKFWKSGIDVRMDKGSEKNPVYIRAYKTKKEKDEEYRNKTKAIGGGVGGWGGQEAIQIQNTKEQRINPATEDKQDEIIGNVSPRSDLEGLGDKTVGTTQVEIAITGTPHTIRLRADTSNTGIIYIGKSGVLADGSNDFVRLESGDEIIMDYDDTTNALYAISNVASQKINIGVIL